MTVDTVVMLEGETYWNRIAHSVHVTLHVIKEEIRKGRGPAMWNHNLHHNYDYNHNVVYE